MHVAGLPLHPLVVHAAVVLIPTSALAALAYAVVRRWRAWLRWPMTAVAVASALVAVVAWVSGRSFRSELYARGLRNPWIATHAHRASVLLLLTLVLTVAVVAVGARLHPLADGTAATRVVPVVLVLLALAVLVSVVLTGDAGARAVYGG